MRLSAAPVKQFWDTIYASDPDLLARFAAGSAVEYGDAFWSDAVFAEALKHFGNLRGMKLLDIGCGRGQYSLAFAAAGADVTAIDISTVAIDDLQQFCTSRGIPNVTPIVCSALEIDRLGPFDAAFGNMILHHLEPFGTFARVLRTSLRPEGKAFFHENSGAVPILMWARSNLTGRFGIPKYSDGEEYPLTPQEIDDLRRYFKVDVRHTQVVFIQLISEFLLKKRFKQTLRKVDALLYRVPALRRLSYKQCLALS